MVWLHKNECASHGTDSFDDLSYILPVGSVCLEDSFMIAFPVFSSHGGFLKFNGDSNAIFEDPIISEVPPAVKPYRR